MKDEIIRELWTTKDAIAQEHHHNVKQLVHSLRAKEKAAGVRAIDLSAQMQHGKKTVHTH